MESQLAHSALLANYGNGGAVRPTHNENYRLETFDGHQINYSRAKKTGMGENVASAKKSIG
jgi:hypothetical protein